MGTDRLRRYATARSNLRNTATQLGPPPTTSATKSPAGAVTAAVYRLTSVTTDRRSVSWVSPRMAVRWNDEQADVGAAASRDGACRSGAAMGATSSRSRTRCCNDVRPRRGDAGPCPSKSHPRCFVARQGSSGLPVGGMSASANDFLPRSTRNPTRAGDPATRPM